MTSRTNPMAPTNQNVPVCGLTEAKCSASDFLTAEQIPIGSWWEIAQGGEYGYCVTAVDVPRREATVLSTDGEVREIDIFKLQYRYSRVLPNVKAEPDAQHP